jgi:hypothetical protein
MQLVPRLGAIRRSLIFKITFGYNAPRDKQSQITVCLQSLENKG